MSKIDERAKEYIRDFIFMGERRHQLERKMLESFDSGARAVLEEARRIAAQPDGLLYGTLMLSDLEALFTDMEDHEQR